MRTIILILSLLILPISGFATETIWYQPIATYITDPNISYLLLLIAIYGIFFELANPGAILPGVTGIIALLLVLYSFHILPINYLGILLILTGLSFMIAEVYITSFGIIGLLGVISFIAGSILLFDTGDPSIHIDWALIATMSIISLTFIFIIMTVAIKSHKHKIVSGTEGLIGSEGVVLSVMNEQTVVRVLGEIWDAKSSIPLNPGDKIKVMQVTGLVLIVEPVSGKKLQGE